MAKYNSLFWSKLLPLNPLGADFIGIYPTFGAKYIEYSHFWSIFLHSKRLRGKN